jgi:hypothetical protein
MDPRRSLRVCVWLQCTHSQTYNHPREEGYQTLGRSSAIRATRVLKVTQRRLTPAGGLRLMIS